MKGNKWVISQREFQQSILQAIRVFPAVSTGERRRRICPDERERVSEREREREREMRAHPALTLRSLPLRASDF
ncbi:hypothetical protein QQF64_008116 [Cirrhinus molitorella]|uniref:Uncharacterized protein n=1 Tax=Cirrhinus molitorella TaxID=172907 RepID=A0ABR3M8A3_9TELE